MVSSDAKPKKQRVSTALTAEETNEYNRLHRLAFPERRKAASARYHLKHGDKRRQKNKEWRTRNRPYCNERLRLRRTENPDQFRAYDRKRRVAKTAYMRNRRRSDMNFRLSLILRNRLASFLTGKGKSKKSRELLGCSLDSFKIYLESKFETGMSWENYGRGPGKWNIDHIMPCSIFDLTILGHQKRCFHFSNMQPLWSIENSRKNAKVTTDQFNLL